MYSKLYLKDSYISKLVNYLISSYIREYDIQKANINILYRYGVLNNEEYNRYFNMNNQDRKIHIGYLQRDNKEANKILRDGFIESRRLFFESNDIQDHDVLSIKKDAVYLINKIAHVTEFDNIKFINKNIYTSFYKVPIGLEFYYYLDLINKYEKLDVKGISNDVLKLHENYLLDFLKYIFETAQTTTIDNVVSIISNFYRQYMNLELDIGYYREFNSTSKFKINSKSYTMFYADMLTNNDKQYLDISCNRDILRYLYSYYSNIYFSIYKGGRNG